MGLLDDVMATDAIAFTDTDFGGEAITYTPKGGSATPINVGVSRDTLDGLDESGGTQLVAVIEIEVPMADISTVVVNADTVLMPRRFGGSNETLYVREILAQDAGFWRLLVN